MDRESQDPADAGQKPRDIRQGSPEVDPERLDLGPVWEASAERPVVTGPAAETARSDRDAPVSSGANRIPAGPAIPERRRPIRNPGHRNREEAGIGDTPPAGPQPDVEAAAADLAGQLAQLLTSHLDQRRPQDRVSQDASLGNTRSAFKVHAGDPGEPPSKTGVFVSLDEVLTRMEESREDEWAVAGPSAEFKPGAVYAGLSYAVREIPFARALVDASGHWKSASLLRLLGIAAAAVAGIAAVFAVFSFLQSERNASEAHKFAASVAPTDVVQVAAVRSVLTSYFEAENWEERLRWVRSPEFVQPKMREWYARNPDPGPQKIKRISKVANATYGDTRCVVTGVVLEGSVNPRAVILEWPQGQYYRIDWETLTGYQPKTPTELFSSPEPQESEFRCVLTRSDYFNGPFADESRWRCFTLDYPENDADFFGYVERGSPVDNEIQSAFNKRKKLGALIGVRTAPEANRFRQLEIIELREASWVPQYASRPGSVAPGDAPTEPTGLAPVER